MRVIAIEPKDIHFKIDISLDEIRHLANVLNNSRVDYDSKVDIELYHSVKYVKDDLSVKLMEIIKEAGGDDT